MGKITWLILLTFFVAFSREEQCELCIQKYNKDCGIKGIKTAAVKVHDVGSFIVEMYLNSTENCWVNFHHLESDQSFKVWTDHKPENASNAWIARRSAIQGSKKVEFECSNRTEEEHTDFFGTYVASLANERG